MLCNGVQNTMMMRFLCFWIVNLFCLSVMKMILWIPELKNKVFTDGPFLLCLKALATLCGIPCVSIHMLVHSLTYLLCVVSSCALHVAYAGSAGRCHQSCSLLFCYYLFSCHLEHSPEACDFPTCGDISLSFVFLSTYIYNTYSKNHIIIYTPHL